MSKIFLLGDSHIALGYPNNTDKWHKVHIEYFEEFLIPLLKEKVKKGDIIIHLGDLYDNRNIIPINLLNYGINIVEQIANIAPLHILVGNHDCWHKTSSNITTLKPFMYIPNVFVYDKTTVIEYNGHKLCMMPYIEKKEEQISLIKENLDCSYLFCHSDLNGAKMHLTSAAHKNNDKIDIDEFSNFKKVYSGHIHILDRHKNFTFVGNNFEMDRNDIDNQKGLFILDTNKELELFIPNNISPKFKKIYVNKEEDIDLLTENVAKDWVDLFVSNNLLVSNRKLRRKIEGVLQNGSFASVEYIDDISIKEEIVEDITANENLTINLDYDEYIKNYIDVQKYEIDKVKNGVLKVFNEVIEIYKESKKKLD